MPSLDIIEKVLLKFLSVNGSKFYFIKYNATIVKIRDKEIIILTLCEYYKSSFIK